MEYRMDKKTKDKLIIASIVILGILLLIFLYSNSDSKTTKKYEYEYREDFNTDNNDNDEINSNNNMKDGLIHPALYQPELNSVITGSDFIGLPDTVIPPWAVNKNNYGTSDTLDGDLGNAGLEFNLCSKSCCSAQYPNGIEMKPDAFVCASKDKFVPTTYTCNNAYEDSGCVCMTAKQLEFLNRRGGNA
jgi:hypothetical protein